jgi:hypothetical protein
MQVDVSTLKKERELSDIKNKIQKQNFISSLKPKKSKFFTRMPRMKPPSELRPMPNVQAPAFVPENDITDDSEFKDVVKKTVFELGSSAIKYERRAKLRERLENSKFLNNYVENQNPLINYIRFQNSHLQAGLIYTYHYLEALK